MKEKQKLARRYGRLTVLGETQCESTGRRVAQVKCKCGVMKLVLADSLLAGKTRTCGGGACKAVARARRDPSYTPSLPRAITVPQLKRAWHRYHHGSPRRRLTFAQLAAEYGVNINTLSSIFRNVRRAGGIDKFCMALEETHGT